MLLPELGNRYSNVLIIYDKNDQDSSQAAAELLLCILANGTSRNLIPKLQLYSMKLSSDPQLRNFKAGLNSGLGNPEWAKLPIRIFICGEIKVPNYMAKTKASDILPEDLTISSMRMLSPMTLKDSGNVIDCLFIGGAMSTTMTVDDTFKSAYPAIFMHVGKVTYISILDYEYARRSDFNKPHSYPELVRKYAKKTLLGDYKWPEDRIGKLYTHVSQVSSEEGLIYTISELQEHYGINPKQEGRFLIKSVYV